MMEASDLIKRMTITYNFTEILFEYAWENFEFCDIFFKDVI